jgi:hypothetical protein
MTVYNLVNQYLEAVELGATTELARVEMCQSAAQHSSSVLLDRAYWLIRFATKAGK